MKNFSLDALLFFFLKPWSAVFIALYSRGVLFLEKATVCIPVGPKSKLQKFVWLRRRALQPDVLQSLRHCQGAVWVHCASGEFEYAKPVISELKAQGLSVVVSYFSPSYQVAIQKNPYVDFSFPVPWDLPQHWGQLLDALKPKVLLMARTDIWLNMLRACANHGVPRVLFASPLSQKRFQASGVLKRLWLRLVLPLMDQISLVSPQEENFARGLVPSTTEVRADGDTRYDQVTKRLEHPQTLREDLRGAWKNAPVMICGSTWPQDEEVLLETIRNSPDWRWVIAPHEPTPEHLKALEAQLHEYGISFGLYSSALPEVDYRVLIVDKVGILAELYQWGTAAFVGGSFRGSVHSVMEPLAAGLVTFVGPYFHNNSEAVRFASAPLSEFQRLTMVNEVEDGDHMGLLMELVHGSAKDPRPEIKAKVAENLGASKRFIEHLRDTLKFEERHTLR